MATTSARQRSLLFGDGGDDQLYGGPGADELGYSGVSCGTKNAGGLGIPDPVTVDNVSGAGTTTVAVTDTFSEIENVTWDHGRL